MALTRTQVILSMEYGFLSNLNNAVRCRMAQANIDNGSCQFDGWHYDTYEVTDSAHSGDIPTSGDILIGGVSNGASGSGGAAGIPQTYYFLKLGAPAEMLVEALTTSSRKSFRRRHRK